MSANGKTKVTRRVAVKPPKRSTRVSADTVLHLLKRRGTKSGLDSLARYGIHVSHAFGVSVGTLRQIAKAIGPSHALAQHLWKTGWYEARMLATMIDEPAKVSATQMNRWCADFDNWAIVDTACFALFTRTSHAWAALQPWSERRGEFQKRAAFALLWSLTVHDRTASNAQFQDGLALIERHASDERHFVKKAINMALRAIGKRNSILNAAAIAVARRLVASDEPNARWVGQHALRELRSTNVQQRLARKQALRVRRTSGRPSGEPPASKQQPIRHQQRERR